MNGRNEPKSQESELAVALRQTLESMGGVAGTPIPGVAMQRMQTSYSTAIAVQKPRDLDAVVRAVHREATYAGASFFYAWGEGKDHIEGPSVECALAVARNWGNCAVESDVREEDDSFVFTAHFVDLESGFTLSRSFRQSKESTVAGRMDEERKMDVRFQVGQSKAIRNVVLNAMPAWLVDGAVEEAKKADMDDIHREGIETSRLRAVVSLAKMGVDEDRILKKLGRRTRNDITEADVQSLRSAYRSLMLGTASARDLFPPISEYEQAPAAGKPAGASPATPPLPKPTVGQAQTGAQGTQAQATPVAQADPPTTAATPAQGPATGPVLREEAARQSVDPSAAAGAPAGQQAPAPATNLTVQAQAVSPDLRCRACAGAGRSTSGRQCRVCHGDGLNPNVAQPAAASQPDQQAGQTPGQAEGAQAPANTPETPASAQPPPAEGTPAARLLAKLEAFGVTEAITVRHLVRLGWLTEGQGVANLPADRIELLLNNAEQFAKSAVV